MPRVSITIPDKNPQPYRFNLDHKKVTIGRSKDSDIVIDDPSVSGLHATMERVDGGYILRDRGSTNGITLDDKLMDIIDLRNGDDVKVGDTVFDYNLTEDELDVLDDEDFSPHEKGKSSSEVSPEPEAEEEVPAPKPKKKSAPKKKRPASPMLPVAAASSSSGGGFFTGLIGLVIGALVFFLGVSVSYERAEEELGRENVNFLKDVMNGKPKFVPKPEGEEEGSTE